MSIPVTLRRNVLQRDRYRCVYCLTTQENSGQRPQIDHIDPAAQGGQTILENLCSCCASCNSHKAARRAALDPYTGQIVPLFHPLEQLWSEHFAWDESQTIIIGTSASGRATVEALQMNNEAIVRARRRWVEAGWHSPT